MSEKNDVLNLLVLSEDVVDFLMSLPDISWSEVDWRRLALHKRLRRGWRNRVDHVPNSVWEEIKRDLNE